MNLSQHFTLNEATQSDTATRLGIDNTPSQTVIDTIKKAAVQLEAVRELLDKPIRINSWYRCKQLNRAIGSLDTSAHTQGWAIDFVCPDYGTPKQICEAIIRSGIEYDQLIQEGTWVHISFDPKKRKQNLTAIFGRGKTQYVKGI